MPLHLGLYLNVGMMKKSQHTYQFFEITLNYSKNVRTFCALFL